MKADTAARHETPALRRCVLAALAGGAIFLNGSFADRDRYIAGATLGAGSGKPKGGLADHSLNVMLPGGIMLGTSGRCYQWTRSGRLVRVTCP